MMTENMSIPPTFAHLGIPMIVHFCYISHWRKKRGAGGEGCSSPPPTFMVIRYLSQNAPELISNTKNVLGEHALARVSTCRLGHHKVSLPPPPPPFKSIFLCPCITVRVRTPIKTLSFILNSGGLVVVVVIRRSWVEFMGFC